MNGPLVAVVTKLTTGLGAELQTPEVVKVLVLSRNTDVEDESEYLMEAANAYVKRERLKPENRANEVVSYDWQVEILLSEETE